MTVKVYKDLKAGYHSQSEAAAKLDDLRKATDIFYGTLMDQEMNLVEQNEVQSS